MGEHPDPGAAPLPYLIRMWRERALLTLDLLSTVEALALLARRVGADRVTAEPEAAARVGDEISPQ
jgi:hypothetical protein